MTKTWASNETHVRNNGMARCGAPPNGVGVSNAARTMPHVRTYPCQLSAMLHAEVPSRLICQLNSFMRIVACGFGSGAWCHFTPKAGENPMCCRS